jgi:hypothetical protein
MRTKDLEFDPVAEIFPLMQGPEFDALVEDIKTNGLREPITMLGGKILDGRNRYLACRALGIEPTYRTGYIGTGTPLNYVVSLNLHRRHLDESQRAMVATKVATMKQGRPESKVANLQVKNITQSEAAKMLNISERSISSARKVLASGNPDLIKAVEQGELAVSKAAKIVEADPGVCPNPRYMPYPEEIWDKALGSCHKLVCETYRGSIKTLFKSWSDEKRAETAEHIDKVVGALQRISRGLKRHRIQKEGPA